LSRILAICLLALSCSSSASADSRPPTGEEVFDLLFANVSLPLGKEPLCTPTSATRGTSEINLGQHLATILSVAHQASNKVSLRSSCEPSKAEGPGGSTEDVWDCRLEMLEATESGEHVSSAMVAFHVSQDRSKLLAGSLRCF
jgi:hypothetical protein